MSKGKKFVIIVIILLISGFCLKSLRPEKHKDEVKEPDKGSYTYYTGTDSEPENDELYFYGK